MGLVKQLIDCDVFRLIVDLIGIGSAIASVVALCKIKKVKTAVENARAEIKSEKRLNKLAKYLTLQSKDITSQCEEMLTTINNKEKMSPDDVWQGLQMSLPRNNKSILVFSDQLGKYNAKDEKIYDLLQRSLQKFVELTGREALLEIQDRGAWIEEVKWALSEIFSRIDGLLKTEGDFDEHL